VPSAASDQPATLPSAESMRPVLRYKVALMSLCRLLAVGILASAFGRSVCYMWLLSNPWQPNAHAPAAYVIVACCALPVLAVCSTWVTGYREIQAGRLRGWWLALLSSGSTGALATTQCIENVHTGHTDVPVLLNTKSRNVQVRRPWGRELGAKPTVSGGGAPTRLVESLHGN
jgi:hypothetical protein